MLEMIYLIYSNKSHQMLIFECCVTIICKCSLPILRTKNTALGYIKVTGLDIEIFIQKKSQDGLRKKVRTK